LIKKLFSDSVIYSVGPQIPKIASLIVLPIITKYLTSTDYGVAGIILAYTGFLGAISDLGFSVLLMNSFYNYKLRWKVYWKQYHFYLSLWAVIYSLILGILLFVIIPVEASENRMLIICLLVIPALIFNVTTIIATRYYQFARKPLYISSVSAIVGVISIFLNLYTIAYLKLGYLGWFISNFLAAFIGFVFYLYPVYFKYKLTPIFKFRKSFLMKSLKISIPVIPHNYSSFLLNTSDRVVMERLKVNTDQIGTYNIAYTFGSYMEFFGNAIGMAIGPIYTSMFSKKNKENSKKIHTITNFLQIFFIIVSFIVSIWCKELFDFFFKINDIENVYPIAIIIIMGYAYRPYYWTAITRLQYSEKTTELWKITFVAGFLNVLLNIIFIPFYGVKAAAISTFVCLLYMGFVGYFLPAFKKIETEKYYPIIFIGLIIFATIFAYLIKDIDVIYKLYVSITLLAVSFIYVYFSLSKLKRDFSN
jgi:O-antigen/teichoic acid export membrane protein